MARRNEFVLVLHVLTGNKFEPSDFSNNNASQVLVTEYFANRSDDSDDDVSRNVCLNRIIVISSVVTSRLGKYS